VATLTESMTRLHSEIVQQGLRRQAFREELARRTKARRESVSGLRAAIARELAGARTAWSAGPRAVAPVEKAPCLAPQRPLTKTFAKNRKKHR